LVLNTTSEIKVPQVIHSKICRWFTCRWNENENSEQEFELSQRVDLAKGFFTPLTECDIKNGNVINMDVQVRCEDQKMILRNLKVFITAQGIN
jgi:hypothetical protein